MKKYFHISHSHNEATAFNNSLDLNKSASDRVSDMNFHRAQFFKLKGIKEDYTVRKVVKIIKRAGLYP